VTDPLQRKLYRASMLARKFGVATNCIAMYLARRRHLPQGIFQASGIENKPIGRMGLKAGGYFVSLEACKGFHAHHREQIRRRRRKTSSDDALGSSSGDENDEENGVLAPPNSANQRCESPSPLSPACTGLQLITAGPSPSPLRRSQRLRARSSRRLISPASSVDSTTNDDSTLTESLRTLQPTTTSRSDFFNEQMLNANATATTESTGMDHHTPAATHPTTPPTTTASSHSSQSTDSQPDVPPKQPVRPNSNASIPAEITMPVNAPSPADLQRPPVLDSIAQHVAQVLSLVLQQQVTQNDQQRVLTGLQRQLWNQQQHTRSLLAALVVASHQVPPTTTTPAAAAAKEKTTWRPSHLYKCNEVNM